MSEAKTYCEKLMKSMEHLLPTAEQKERFRKQAEKVAEESMEGFQQLKEDVKNVAGTMKQGANDALEHLESAFVEFQTNIEALQQRRRQQVDDIHNRLGTLLERLRRADLSGPIKEELGRKTEQVMKKLKESANGMSQEIMNQINELNASYSKANEDKNQEIKTAFEEISQIMSSNNKV